MMTADDPYLFRGKGLEVEKNEVPSPVFGQLGLLACDQRGDERSEPHFDSILRFYILDEAQLLLDWPAGMGDDVAIGDDNDPATFGRPFFSSANLLLNCLFHQDRPTRSSLCAGRESGAANPDLLLDFGRDSYLHLGSMSSVSNRRAQLIPCVLSRHGYVLEVPPDED